MAGIGETKHPLLTPNILECIFKKLRVSDLKTCRQVNRLWHQEATVAMRSAVKVKFESRSRRNRKETSVNGNKIMDFLNLVQSELSTFSSLPFVNNFELLRVRIDYPEFWAFCGSSIKSLGLCDISLDSAYIFRHAIFQSCQNMEDLVLFNVKVAGSIVEEPLAWVEPRFPQNSNLKRLKLVPEIQLGSISYLELLSYFPSLEEIVINEENGSKFFQSLATCREHDPQCWNVKSISFDIEDVWEPESDLCFLWNGKPSLETLDVSGVLEPEHVSVLKNILSFHAATLKSLELTGYKAVETFDGTMMEKLVHLDLSCAKFTSLSFFRIMPNLKKLELYYCTLSLERELSDEPLNHWVASSCAELTVTEPSVHLLKMFRILPNVKKLYLNNCDNELFAGICEAFPNLVCLELLRSAVDDCGISGLDEDDAKRINEDGNFGWFWWRPVTVARPNLSTLKNLKWFRYKAKNPTRHALGFCAALCGVQQLPQLQHLKMEGCLQPIWNGLCDKYQWKDPGRHWSPV